MTTHLLQSFTAENSNLTDMMRTQGLCKGKSLAVVILRVDFFLLGIFMCLHDSRLLFNLDEKTSPSWKNQRLQKNDLPQLYTGGQSS